MPYDEKGGCTSSRPFFTGTESVQWLAAAATAIVAALSAVVAAEQQNEDNDDDAGAVSAAK